MRLCELNWKDFSDIFAAGGDALKSRDKGWKLFLYTAVGIELTDVSPQVLGLLLVLDAREDHFGLRDLRRWIFNVAGQMADAETSEADPVAR